MAHKTAIGTFLVAIMVSSLALGYFSIAQAQSIPKPSVPEFAITIANTNGTPSIQVTILNQALRNIENGKTYHLYYNVRIKDHSSETWKELYPLQYHASSQDNVYVELPYVYAPIQSSSDKTILSIPNSVYPSDNQLDIQVQTIIGHDSQFWVGDHPTQPQISGYYEAATAFDYSSDWSSTQTVSISDISGSVEFIVYFVLGVVIALLVVIAIFIYRRTRILEIK